MDHSAQQPMVLVAKADALVGTDLCDALEWAGYQVLGPFATTGEALIAIEQACPTVAVVDVVLRDGVCTALEARLRQRGIPFLIHSGLPQFDPRALSFQGVPWLDKPALPEDVAALLDKLSGPPASVAAQATIPASSAHAAGPGSNPLVRKLEGFVALADADRAILEQITAQPRLLGPRVDLIREDDTPTGVFVIMDGMAFRHKIRGNGARQITAYLVPGDLGDIDVALLKTMDHTITTASACQVVHIAPGILAEVMANHPRIARALRMSTLVHEATLREWLVNAGCRSALERLAHLFCELLVRLRAVDRTQGDSYELPVTQLELGHTTGLSNVHVNRSLQELRRRGLIELKDRRLTIRNLPRLKAVAEFQSDYLHLGDHGAV